MLTRYGIKVAIRACAIAVECDLCPWHHAQAYTAVLSIMNELGLYIDDMSDVGWVIDNVDGQGIEVKALLMLALSCLQGGMEDKAGFSACKFLCEVSIHRLGLDPGEVRHCSEEEINEWLDGKSLFNI